MREIKFRAQEKSSGSWVYGNLQIIRLMARGVVEKEIYKIIPVVLNIDNPAVVIPETVGEYTGLKDKNGVEGFESDILNTPVGKAVICLGEYSQPTGEERHIGFYLKFESEYGNGIYRKDIGYWLPKSEVIGNIYENTDLLGGASCGCD